MDILFECNKLEELLHNNCIKDEFLKQMEIIREMIPPPNIDKLISKLKDDFSEEIMDEKEIISDINKIIMVYLTKENKYIPINYKYKDLYLSRKNMQGLSFLCPELDKLTGGIFPGNLLTIVGGPGCMKTTYAINICYNAIKKGKNVCFLSLEETPFQLYSKLLSRTSLECTKPIEVQDILQNKLDQDDREYLFNSVQKQLEEYPGSFCILGEDDLVSYDMNNIETKLKEIDLLISRKSKEKTGEEHGIDLLVVDHLQLFKYNAVNSDQYQVENAYVNFFRKHCLSFLNRDRQISVILLSQVNREGIAYAQKHNGMYMMQHVAEASEIERASSYIISVYTDPTVQITKLLKMGAIKLRGATLPMDTINVLADGSFYRVGEIPIPEQQSYSSDIFNSENTQEYRTMQTSSNVDTTLISSLFDSM